MRNAIIRSADILIEDHGILTFFLNLDYGGAGQGFGGWSLDGDKAGYIIRRILEVVGVSHWKDLVGAPVRVEGDVLHLYKIGHFLKEEWFEPAGEVKI